MFWFQELARRYTDKPVLMSSLVQLPSITTAFAHHEQVPLPILQLVCNFPLISVDCLFGLTALQYHQQTTNSGMEHHIHMQHTAEYLGLSNAVFQQRFV